MSMATVNVRYMVDDVDAAVAWYTRHPGFSLSNAAPAFADVSLGSVLSAIDAIDPTRTSDTDLRGATQWSLLRCEPAAVRGDPCCSCRD
jgi:catechol 2,3-dioxygenase-like lactoylglutathione lyase family enzyme